MRFLDIGARLFAGLRHLRSVLQDADASPEDERRISSPQRGI